MQLGAAGSHQLDGLRISWSVASDVGKVRSLNEDSVLARPGMFVVADGMGGHAAGDVASAIAVEAFDEQADSIPLTLDAAEALIVEANRRVRERAHAEQTMGMGTTLIGVVLIQNGDSPSLLMFNVGDSRCYTWSNADGLKMMSHDHSLVQELVDANSITSAEAHAHPDRNVVTRAIGVEPSVAADFVVLPQLPEFRILLCSDGVSGQVDETVVAEVLADAHAARTGAGTLVERVLAGVAPDNATCIVVDVEWPSVPGDAGELDSVTGPPPARAVVQSGVIGSIPGFSTDRDRNALSDQSADSPNGPSPRIDRVPT